MKRALLIAGGTVGGLGAVLAITPPQLGSTSAINIAGAPMAGQGATTVASASSSSSATTVATTKATAVATTKPTKKAGATAAATSAATTAPATAATTAPATINGTFTGPSVFVNYGNVQVKITVVNGRITDAVAVKAPSGRNDRWTNMAVPILKEQTLKAQSANIQGASGASYTSYGWHTSLQGALAQAGL
ncbi:FMN-binding [Candidatus Nanopelagicaceae bacterium]